MEGKEGLNSVCWKARSRAAAGCPVGGPELGWGIGAQSTSCSVEGACSDSMLLWLLDSAGAHLLGRLKDLEAFLAGLEAKRGAWRPCQAHLLTAVLARETRLPSSTSRRWAMALVRHGVPFKCKS